MDVHRYCNMMCDYLIQFPRNKEDNVFSNRRTYDEEERETELF